MNRNNVTTIQNMISYAIDLFEKKEVHYGHGFENDLDEIAYLIKYALGIETYTNDINLHTNLTEKEKLNALELLDRRAEERIPSAYITRETWLENFCFYVDQRVIIPRSHLASYLCNQLQPWISEPSEVKTILDLCTGSGCLAIIAALNFPKSQIDATDISRDAIEVAKINISKYKLRHRVKTYLGNLSEPLDQKKYDIIISNPPYVETQLVKGLPREYQYEPTISLDGGTNGILIIKKIIEQAIELLTETGILFIEVGRNKRTLEILFPSLPFVWLTVGDGSMPILCISKKSLSDLY